jgi:HEAT repeat protein
MRWILMMSMAAALASRGLAATDAQCTEILQRALGAINPETRAHAVSALSLASGSGPLFDQLERMLQDKDVGVRQAVVASLADVKSEHATAALKKALEDPVPEVSFAAAKALWARHDPAGRDALLDILSKENKSSSSFFSKQKREALRMMYTPRTTLLFAAEQGIGFVPLPGMSEGFASMQGILASSGVPGRASAALLLGADMDPATVDALRDALTDKNSAVRAAAVHSISLRNDPTLKKDLEPLLQDEKESVRLRAAAGYLRLSAIEAGIGTTNPSTAVVAPGAQGQKKEPGALGSVKIASPPKK